MTFVPSDAQRHAIEAPAGPVLVVAGPGAGKTFCLIARIGYLIARLGVEPRRICAVTFTNKAADEIAARLRREVGPAAEEITRGTLHALCLLLLREHAARLGLRRGFGIADEEYQRRLLRRLRVRPERHTQVLNLFGRHRLQHAPLTAADGELFQAYRDALRARNLLDYDDLIARAGELLRGHPEAAAVVRERWDCLLVDEFQDLSLAQYEVVTQIVRNHRHCFAVGDDEQSIFSWTGADPGILLRFGTDFAVEPIVLDHNRRCSRQIFAAARRLVTRNPALFDKQLDADRVSEHEVAARVFPDERAEAAWLVADLRHDQAACGLGWGEYALLYRAHRIGQHLETALVEAGIPCRLARGQALADDEIIGFVVSSLGVIRAPDDPLALEGFAGRTLPRTLLDQLRLRFRHLDLVTALRAYARSAPRGDPDARKAWRFVFHVENLAALSRSHDALQPLVDELLGQRLGPYRNPLEERAAELTDPADFPGAAHIADRLAETQARGGMVWVQPDRGVEIPLLRILRAGLGDYVRPLYPEARPSPADLVLRAGAARPLLLFKALQLLHCRGLADPFQDYVAFDIETTDLDVAGCEVIELAAVRVRGRVVVDQFSHLIRADRPVSPAASKVHGYRDADLCDQPTFAEVWPGFRAFVGDDILVAHNGQEFDVPVLRRLAAGLAGTDELVFFDTLPLARSLLEESARLGDLAHRFGVDTGRSHHALDDAGTLAGVLRHLGDLKIARSRKAALAHLLGWLGLALALDDGGEPTAEERLLREIALPATLGRYGDCLDIYAEEREAAGAPAVEELIERLGGARLMERIRTQRSAAERYPSSVARLQALVEASAAPTLAESIDLLLGRVALSRSDGVPADAHRINLLTLHSTKGLEFSRVYVVGAEDAQLPGLRALDDETEAEIQEARRLLYVGMTRAKDRLVLTRAERRDGRHAGGSLFLREAGLVEALEPAAGLTVAKGA
ncbi:MAG TPA: UvrD-helicase domain-containing protein [Gemmatimonadales bacterium]|nr:UvrD-helicase domain-containing protein [Gemmatimonadales bacterium]